MVKLTELLFERESSAHKKSEKFARKVRDDVYPILFKQAKFILSAMRSGKKPSDSEVLSQINYYMRQNAGENPLESVDTYGVMLMLGYLLKDKDPKFAGKAKKYFRSAVDAWLKKQFGRYLSQKDIKHGPKDPETT